MGSKTWHLWLMRGVKSSSGQVGLHPSVCFTLVSSSYSGLKLQWVCGVKSDSLKMTQKRGSADPVCFFPVSRAATSFLCRILLFLRYNVSKNTRVHNTYKCMPADYFGGGDITVCDRAWKRPRRKQTSCQILTSPVSAKSRTQAGLCLVWSAEGIGMEQ